MNDKTSRKERIVAAAQALFAERGYEGTSIRSIAKEASVSLPLLVHHFGSKDELFQVIFRNAASFALKHREAAMGRVLASTRQIDIETVLTAFSDSWIELWQTERSTALLLSQFRAGPAPGHIDLIAEFIDPTSTLFLSTLEDICPGVCRDIVHAQFHFYAGALVHFNLDHERITRLSGPAVADTRASLLECATMIGERLRSLASTVRRSARG